MITKFKDIHKGERCFIVGTGPSLNKTNLNLLKNEICFGVNTLYTGLDNFGIKCQYWAVGDDTIITNHSRNIMQNVETTLFSCSPGGNRLEKQKGDKCKEVFNIQFLGYMSEGVSFDISKGAFNGNTVILDVCLQVAYYMGFSKVYLIGCDSDYSKNHRFNSVLSDVKTSPAIEGNFSQIFQSYEVCKRFYEQDNREIINCTVGGKLEIFKRQSLKEVITGKTTKVIAMIPALLGSTRIQNKNMLLVNGFPLIYYVVKACKESRVFDDIYINSEHEEFKEIAERLDVKFFKRNIDKGGTNCLMNSKSMDCKGERCQVHDHYIVDFLENVKCDYIVQVHTTSPLITPETIREFVGKLETEKYNTLFTIEEKYVNTLIDEKPINFNASINSRNQDLKPIQILSWAMSGWKSNIFLESYYKNDIQDGGPTYSQPIGYFPISSIEAIDIDNYDDLFIAEACLSHLKRKDNVGKFCYNKEIKEIDNDLTRLITRDGVSKFENKFFNSTKTNIKEIKAKMGDGPWCYQLIYTDNDQTCLIHQLPGEGCRPHYHTSKDEYWFVAEGSFEWKTDKEVIAANEGDFVFMPKGTPHTITCIGKKAGIRLACGAKDMEHIYL